MTRTEDSREIALDILMEILEREGLSHQVLRQALSKYQYLDKAERSFITRLSEGTVEYLPQIDHVLGACSSVKVHKMKPVIRTILRMSVYQLLYICLLYTSHFPATHPREAYTPSPHTKKEKRRPIYHEIRHPDRSGNSDAVSYTHLDVYKRQ